MTQEWTISTCFNVEDAVRRSTTDDIELTGIRREIRAWTGLSIPTDVVKTLLQRATKKKLLTRAGGRYLRTQDYGQDPKWGALMSELELAHKGSRLTCADTPVEATN